MTFPCPRFFQRRKHSATIRRVIRDGVFLSILPRRSPPDFGDFSAVCFIFDDICLHLRVETRIVPPIVISSGIFFALRRILPPVMTTRFDQFPCREQSSVNPVDVCAASQRVIPLHVYAPASVCFDLYRNPRKKPSPAGLYLLVPIGVCELPVNAENRVDFRISSRLSDHQIRAAFFTRRRTFFGGLKNKTTGLWIYPSFRQHFPRPSAATCVSCPQASSRRLGPFYSEIPLRQTDRNSSSPANRPTPKPDDGPLRAF